MSTMRCPGACSASSLKAPTAFIGGPTSRGCRLLSRFLRPVTNKGSGRELFLDDPLFEIGVIVEQQRHFDVAVLFDLHCHDVTRFGEIGDRADRAFVGLERLYSNARPMRQQRAAPAA